MNQIRKIAVKVVALLLIALQLLSTSLPVYALGNLDFSTTMMTALINDSRQFLAPGIEERRITLLNSQGQRIENFVLEVDLQSNPNTIVTGSYKDGFDYGMSTVRDQADYAAINGKPVVAAVNADFYNMATGEPTGCFVKEGREIKSLPSNWSFFGVKADGTAVIGDHQVYQMNKGEILEALGGQCLVVKDGQAVDFSSGSYSTHYTSRHPRTAVGIKADGSVVFMVSDGRQEPYSAGLTMTELAELMRDLGCVTALNLDGGGSSTYLARKQGTDFLACKNSPSDGGERTVANSFLILANTASDHVFSRAAIAPQDKAYTPNSTIKFTAAGMDASGASAALPQEGLVWRLSDNSFGEIDPTTGQFVSNGKQGQVEIQLVWEESTNTVTGSVYGQSQHTEDNVTESVTESVYKDSNTVSQMLLAEGEIIGTTYLEIAMPDSLSFNQPEISLPFDSSSDLGFKAQYRGRDVILKSGDILWDIPAGTGTMDTNNIFHSSPSGSASGLITATLAGTSLTASIDVKVGQLPVVLYDFEDGVGEWKSSSANRGEIVSLAAVEYASGEPVRFGDKSLKINFDLTGAQTNTTLGVYAGPGSSKPIPGSPSAIGAWIYATEEAQGYWLRMYLYDVNNASKVINFTENYPGINWTGWKYIEAPIPSDFQGPFRTYPNQMIRMMSTKSGMPGGLPMTKGEIYVDNVRVVYGENVDDLFNPIINDINVDGKIYTTDTVTIKTTFTDNMEDKYASGINYERVHMYVDGKDYTRAPGIYALNMGQNEASLSELRLPDGKHRVDVVVQDNFGNETKKTAYFTVNTETGTTVGLDSPDKDSAVLGGGYRIHVNTNNIADIETVSTKIKIGKEFPVEGVDFTSDTSDSTYSYDAKKGMLTLNIRNKGTQTVKGTLATIHVKIPIATLAGQNLEYSVESSDITYNSNKGDKYAASFCEMPVSVAIVSPYTVEILDAMVGREGVVLVKDRSGNPVEGATVKVVSNGGTVDLGVTDDKGIVKGSAMTDVVKKVSVYAEKDGLISFTINTQSLKPLKDKIPSNILATGVEQASTSKNITWMSNPLTSESAAIMQIALKEDYDAYGESAFRDIEGDFKEGSFIGDSDINNNGIVRFSHAVASGLTTGADYCFRVGDGINWSEVKTFKTTAEGADTKFFILGDTQTANTTNLRAILSALENSSTDYNFALHVGDIIDDAARFNQLDAVSQALGGYEGAFDTDLVVVLGNHEYMGDEEGYIARTYYNTPLNGPEENIGACYSVEYGDVYIGVIGWTTSRELLEKELNWLKKDIAKTDKRWKVLLTHQPVYYSNPEGGNGLFKEMLPPVMDELGIHFVISGHDHAYGRTAQLRGGEKKAGGTTYIIAGSTGEKYYGAVNDGSFEVFNDEQKPIYITVEATKESVSFHALRPDGTVVDTFTVEYSSIEEEKKIVGIKEVNISTIKSNAPKLPSKVTVVYDDGSEEEVAVIWEPIDSEKYGNTGVFTVEGTVEGTNIKAVANVNVYEETVEKEIVGIKEVNISTIRSNAPALPSKVTVVYDDGSEEEVAVIWEPIDSEK
ncbi:MAG: phosphodiester glycosidase family protein, partial [Thermotaleaceae bacterium]